MLFNSIPFALFLPCVLVLYWAVQRAPLRVQNSLLLLASYVFYGMWDWRFPILLLASSAVDYLVSLKLPEAQAPGRKKLLLGLSVAVNLMMLAFFKYFNFFVISFAEFMRLFGLNASIYTIRILMPVGISYYTF